MKLTTRSRYGTRLMLDLAQHYKQGPCQIADVANRQDVSAKYLEQIIIPLKKARLITSIRGPKGGHMLARPPEEISVGEIVMLLEKDTYLAPCLKDPSRCGRRADCKTRDLWDSLMVELYRRLHSISLKDLGEMNAGKHNHEGDIHCHKHP
jgi:Rrf2 family protein